MKTEDGLTPKQELFCQEFLRDLNQTQAAIRAGYSKDSAYNIGYENMNKPQIASRVRELMEARSKAVIVDAHFVISSLVENVKKSQQAEPVLEWNHEEKAYVPTGEYQYDSQGANRALELLGKHLGIFEKDNTQKVPLIPSIINVHPTGG